MGFKGVTLFIIQGHRWPRLPAFDDWRPLLDRGCFISLRDDSTSKTFLQFLYLFWCFFLALQGYARNRPNHQYHHQCCDSSHLHIDRRDVHGRIHSKGTIIDRMMTNSIRANPTFWCFWRIWFKLLSYSSVFLSRYLGSFKPMVTSLQSWRFQIGQVGIFIQIKHNCDSHVSSRKFIPNELGYLFRSSDVHYMRRYTLAAVLSASNGSQDV